MALERFARDVQAFTPDMVIVQFGLNDCNRWETDRYFPRVSRKAFAANLTEIVDRARWNQIEPILASVTPTLKGERYQTDADAYDATIRDVAADTSTHLIDVHRALTLEDCLLPDGIHLNPRGHRLYADTVQRVLSRLLVPA